MRDHRKMDPELRRRIMASIRKTDTRPELMLRQALWKAGLRGWRCHLKKLPGTPDLAFPRWRVAVHVDGVWWHGHPDYFHPGRRGPYWDKKIAGNQARDRAVDLTLKEMGWKSVRVWDMEVLNKVDVALRRVTTALRSRGWAPPADS
jgi:DNA mismatch endonuclease (patch repair protein)